MSDDHANFNDLANETLDQFENPPLPVPAGTWLMRAVSAKYEPDKVSQKGNTYSQILVNCRAVEPGDDVDPEAVEEAAEDWPTAAVFHRMFLNDKPSKHKAFKFFKGLGIEVGGKTWQEACDLVKTGNYEFYGTVSVEYDDDGDARNGDVKFSHSADE